MFKKLTQIKYSSTEVKELKRYPPNESGHMLPYYMEEERENVFVEEKKIVQANF